MSFASILVPPRARIDDPETSKEAARKVLKKTINQAVLLILIRLEKGHASHDQIIEYLMKNMDISESGCRTRTNELLKVKLVYWDGTHGRSKMGNRSRYWGLTPLGKKVLHIIRHDDEQRLKLGDAITKATKEGDDEYSSNTVLAEEV